MEDPSFNVFMYMSKTPFESPELPFFIIPNVTSLPSIEIHTGLVLVSPIH